MFLFEILIEWWLKICILIYFNRGIKYENLNRRDILTIQVVKIMQSIKIL